MLADAPKKCSRKLVPFSLLPPRSMRSGVSDKHDGSILYTMCASKIFSRVLVY